MNSHKISVFLLIVTLFDDLAIFLRHTVYRLPIIILIIRYFLCNNKNNDIVKIYEFDLIKI